MDDDVGGGFALIPFLLGRWGGAYLLIGIVVVAIVRYIEPPEAKDPGHRFMNEISIVYMTIFWPFLFAMLCYVGFRYLVDGRAQRIRRPPNSN